MQLQIIQLSQEMRHLEFLELRCTCTVTWSNSSFVPLYTSTRTELSELLSSESFTIRHAGLHYILVSSEDPAVRIPDELWQVRRLDNGYAHLEAVAADVAQTVSTANQTQFEGSTRWY